MFIQDVYRKLFFQVANLVSFIRKIIIRKQIISKTELVDLCLTFSTNRNSHDEIAKKVHYLIECLVLSTELGSCNIDGKEHVVHVPGKVIWTPSRGEILITSDIKISPDGIAYYLYNMVKPSEINFYQALTLNDIKNQEYDCSKIKLPSLFYSSEEIEISHAEFQLLPPEIRRVIILSSKFNERNWVVDSKTLDFIAQTYGLQENTQSPNAHATREQLDIIREPNNKKIVVEAPPGSGKTSSIIWRLKSMIGEMELSATKILVLSFSRNAISDIRNRLEIETFKELDDVMSGVFTFDSFSWQITRRARGENPTLGLSFEDNIKLAISEIENNHSIKDYISTFRHLIIDEAQDIGGIRLDFATKIIENLNPKCGISIFGDRAQAIYGFNHKSANNLMNEIWSNDKFQRFELNQNHRTLNQAIIKTLNECRRITLDSQRDNLEKYDLVRHELEKSDRKKRLSEIAELSRYNKLVLLCRSWGSIFSITDYFIARGEPFRIRINPELKIVKPWIGILLFNLDPNAKVQEIIDNKIIVEKRSNIPDNPKEEIRKIVEFGFNIKTINQLGEMILSTPPEETLIAFAGISGPTISTIHSFKGLESDNVVLFLGDKNHRHEPGEKISEEVRVLYVGATRAKNNLYYSSLKYSYKNWSKFSERFTYSSEENSIKKMEIRTVGDLDEGHFACYRDFKEIEEILELEKGYFKAKFVKDQNQGTYKLYTDSIEFSIGTMSSNLLQDIKDFTCKSFNELPTEIGGIRILGLKTIVARNVKGGAYFTIQPIIFGMSEIRQEF